MAPICVGCRDSEFSHNRNCTRIFQFTTSKLLFFLQLFVLFISFVIVYANKSIFAYRNSYKHEDFVKFAYNAQKEETMSV